MPWIVANIRWIMIGAGLLTATMINVALRPDAALLSMFGETPSGAVAQVVVRSWGALIAVVGGMLIYGAVNRATRSLVLIVAGLSKAIFIALVLAQGSRFLGYQAGIAVVADSIMIALFAWYLVAARGVTEGR